MNTASLGFVTSFGRTVNLTKEGYARDAAYNLNLSFFIYIS